MSIANISQSDFYFQLLCVFILNYEIMKKKNLKSLKLNKKSISNLENKDANNAYGGSATCYPLLCMIVASVANGTDGNCVQTWGDPGCITGIDAICKQ
jgi:hypothetical protein